MLLRRFGKARKLVKKSKKERQAVRNDSAKGIKTSTAKV